MLPKTRKILLRAKGEFNLNPEYKTNLKLFYNVMEKKLDYLWQAVNDIDLKANYLLGFEGIILSVIFSEEQVDLVNKLLELNVSKVTAVNLIKNNDQGLIEKWIEAINYSNADNKAAYLVKAIRENQQFPEEYLREIKEKQQREEEENKKRQEEIKKIEQIYNSLNPLQQEEIKIETENRLPDFWKVQLNKERIKGKTSKMLEVVLEEKRREIIKEWINSGRIKDINSKA